MKPIGAYLKSIKPY